MMHRHVFIVTLRAFPGFGPEYISDVDTQPLVRPRGNVSRNLDADVDPETPRNTLSLIQRTRQLLKSNTIVGKQIGPMNSAEPVALGQARIETYWNQKPLIDWNRVQYFEGKSELLLDKASLVDRTSREERDELLALADFARNGLGPVVAR